VSLTLDAAFRDTTRFAVVSISVRIVAAANIRPATHRQTSRTFLLHAAATDLTEHRLFIVSICAEHALSACCVPPPELTVWCREQTMTEYPYILFNKSPEQMRHLGACGGKAYGRNQRARRALLPTPPQAVPPPAKPQETAAKAIHSLDVQFPWLRGAEK
jgi:hypothetical protein